MSYFYVRILPSWWISKFAPPNLFAIVPISFKSLKRKIKKNSFFHLDAAIVAWLRKKHRAPDRNSQERRVWGEGAGLNLWFAGVVQRYLIRARSGHSAPIYSWLLPPAPSPHPHSFHAGWCIFDKYYWRNLFKITTFEQQQVPGLKRPWQKLQQSQKRRWQKNKPNSEDLCFFKNIFVLHSTLVRISLASDPELIRNNVRVCLITKMCWRQASREERAL